MVRITNSLYHEAYEYIKQDSTLGGNCIIFVASDVDSICAVHIFQVKKKKKLVDTRDFIHILVTIATLINYQNRHY